VTGPALDGLILGEDHYPSDDVPLEVIITLIIMFVAAAIRFATNAASVDALTGLPNRRVFMARLRRATAESAASAHPLSMAILDLDHFKQFNDSRGHDAGDRLLEATALEWQVKTHGKDVLARIGGEEFGLIVEGGVADCRAAAERARVMAAAA